MKRAGKGHSSDPQWRLKIWARTGDGGKSWHFGTICQKCVKSCKNDDFFKIKIKNKGSDPCRSQWHLPVTIGSCHPKMTYVTAGWQYVICRWHTVICRWQSKKPKKGQKLAVFTEKTFSPLDPGRPFTNLTKPLGKPITGGSVSRIE
jgi:hypothetical protein